MGRRVEVAAISKMNKVNEEGGWQQPGTTWGRKQATPSGLPLHYPRKFSIAVLKS